MNKAAKVTIAAVIAVGLISIASKAKNAMDKVTFHITGYKIQKLSLSGLTLLVRSTFINDTGQSFTVTDLLTKLLYQTSPTTYEEVARAIPIPSIEFVHSVPKEIDTVFELTFGSILHLLRTGTVRITSFLTVLGFEQTLITDIKTSDMKNTIIAKASTIPFVLTALKALGLSGMGGNNFTDLNSNQYEVV